MNNNSNEVNSIKDIKSDQVIFDGNEGNLYFFTDSADNALTIKDDENLLFKYFEFDANTYVGETFIIKIKIKEFKNNVGDSKAVLELKLNKELNSLN